MGYIYMLIDKRNGKKYIGKHNGNKKDYWSSGLVPNRIAKKYGREIFDRVILEDNIENDLLNEKEVFYIKQEDTFNNGYNSTIGGDGGGHWIYQKSEEEIKLISEIKSKKLSGRTFSDETRIKMSESAKKKIFTDEHKKNIGFAVKKRGGKKHTDETKKKLSIIKTGIKNEQHSKFMSENNPKAQPVSIENIIYLTIKDASEKLNIPRYIIKNRIKSNKEKYKNWFKIKKT
jgi:group I intron endonuclease